MYISSVSMKLPESMKCSNSGRPLFFFFPLSGSFMVNESVRADEEEEERVWSC